MLVTFIGGPLDGVIDNLYVNEGFTLVVVGGLEKGGGEHHCPGCAREFILSLKDMHEWNKLKVHYSQYQPPTFYHLDPARKNTFLHTDVVLGMAEE